MKSLKVWVKDFSIAYMASSILQEQQTGTVSPSHIPVISKPEPKLSSECDLSNPPPVYSSPHHVRQSDITIEDTTSTIKYQDIHKATKPQLSQEFVEKHGSISDSSEQAVTHTRQITLEDNGPGPPKQKLAVGEHGNQQVGFAPSESEAIVKETSKEEGACSAHPGDKTTTATSKGPKDEGAGSSAAQTSWTASSTDVCPWEDE